MSQNIMTSDVIRHDVTDCSYISYDSGLFYDLMNFHTYCMAGLDIVGVSVQPHIPLKDTPFISAFKKEKSLSKV